MGRRPRRAHGVFVLAAGIAALLSGRGVRAEKPPDWTAALERVAPCVVTVEILLENDARKRGTGFFVTKDGVVATCRHLFRRVRAARVFRDDGTALEVTGVRDCDPRSDLVLLAVSFPGAATVPWGESTTLAVGAPVAMLGSAKGVKGAFVEGTFIGRKDAMGIVGLLETTAGMEPGLSGCPLFDPKGRLLGMGSLRLDWDTPSGFSVPVERLKGLVEGFPNGTAVRPFAAEAAFLNASEWEVQVSPEMVAARNAFLGKDVEARVKAMEELVKRRPRSALAMYFLAQAQAAADKYPDAVTSLERAIAIFGEYLEAWSALGVALERLKRHEAAVEAFKRAVEIDPDDVEIAFWFGSALVGAKDYPHAILVLENVTQTVSDDPEPWEWLGTAYLRAGRTDDASAVVERLRPAHPDVAERLAARIAKRKK